MDDDLGFHARHARATRETILDAVERRLERGGVDDLTFLQIAQEAGVSDRTVYRHFATKDALLEAFWLRVQQSLGIASSTRSWADYVATRPAAFAEMDRRDAVLRALMNSTQAHEARLKLNKDRQAGIRKVVAEAVGELPEPQFTELCALVHLLGSAPAWQALKDYWGLEAPDAGRVVAKAVTTLTEAARRAAAPPSPEAKS